MQIQKVKIDDLNSPEWNPRDMPPEEMEKLKRSINEFGYVEPVVVNEFNMNIVGGNQRVQALKELGYATVDAVMINEPDLNREKSLNITLNNVHGDWDLDLLNEIIIDMELDGFDVSLTSLDDVQLAELEIGGGGISR